MTLPPRGPLKTKVMMIRRSTRTWTERGEPSQDHLARARSRCCPSRRCRSPSRSCRRPSRCCRRNSPSPNSSRDEREAGSANVRCWGAYSHTDVGERKPAVGQFFAVAGQAHGFSAQIFGVRPLLSANSVERSVGWHSSKATSSVTAGQCALSTHRALSCNDLRR